MADRDAVVPGTVDAVPRAGAAPDAATGGCPAPALAADCVVALAPGATGGGPAVVDAAGADAALAGAAGKLGPAEPGAAGELPAGASGPAEGLVEAGLVPGKGAGPAARGVPGFAALADVPACGMVGWACTVAAGRSAPAATGAGCTGAVPGGAVVARPDAASAVVVSEPDADCVGVCAAGSGVAACAARATPVGTVGRACTVSWGGPLDVGWIVTLTGRPAGSCGLSRTSSVSPPSRSCVSPFAACPRTTPSSVCPILALSISSADLLMSCAAGCAGRAGAGEGGCAGTGMLMPRTLPDSR